MGLEIMAYRFKKSSKNQEDLFYKWDKHYPLYNYLEKIYKQREGTEIYFDGIPVELNIKDIENLESFFRNLFDLDSDNINYYYEQLKEDLNFILNAKLAIKDGYSVKLITQF